MNSKILLAAALLPIVVRMGAFAADLNFSYANKGTDLVFRPTQSTNVELSRAASAPWESAPPVPGAGVYDEEKWAVVYKFARVDIPAGVTVTFKNHPSRAPVVWLVDGDVTIAGNISVSAQSQTDPEQIGEPGPGGFRGGLESHPGLDDMGDGLGPGGGKQFGGGSYGTVSAPGPFGGNGPAAIGVYGNSRIVPLVGGSGAGGHGDEGGSGGGALLILARRNLDLDGAIDANGGCCSIGGSGGAVRLIAGQVTGAGRISALGYVRIPNGGYGFSGDGRIRLETLDPKASFLTRPEAVFVPPDLPIQIWPGTADPWASIVSVGGQSVRNDPRAEWRNGIEADLLLKSTGNVEVLVRCRNVPKSGRVLVRGVPKRGPSRMEKAEYESGDLVESLWKAKVPLGAGYSIFQAYAFTE